MVAPSLLSSLAFFLAVGSIVPVAASQSETDNSAVDAIINEWRARETRAAAQPICPSSCQENDPDSHGSSWFRFPDAASLAACNETMLLSFNIQGTVVDGQQAPVAAIRGCTADYSPSSTAKALAMSRQDIAAVCSTPNHDIVEAAVTIGKPAGNAANTNTNSNGKASLDDLLSAGHQVQSYLAAKEPSCKENVIAFGYSRSTVVGVFAGAQVYQHGVHADILTRFLEDAESKNTFEDSQIVQLCPAAGRGADYAVGVIAAPAGDLTLAQEIVRTWADGRCVAGDLDDYMSVSIRVPRQVLASNSTSTTLNSTNSLFSASSGSSIEAHAWSKPRLAARATCTTTTVVSGDGCSAIAQRCGISQSDLTNYNPASTFCTTLVPGQVVCCSAGTLPDPIPPANSNGTCQSITVVGGDSCASLASKCGLKATDFNTLHSSSSFCSTLAVGERVCCTRGDLPDITPKPSSDGSCAVYTVNAGDGCSTIAASHGITVDDIESYNNNTWGWNGCDYLLANAQICLSTGSPPFPQSVSNAICGPQVPGTSKPSSGTSDDWADLNPCPLNVCCNIWGQCGTTDDFCTISESNTGAPGTSKPGENGCISNCGREIIRGSPPAQVMRIAYFEAWNSGRPCLNMDVDQIDTSKYTHIHFAFGNITSDFNIDVSGAQDQFDRFKAMTGVKKIISFGGWDFSTAPGTFNILREAMKDGNRDIFKYNVLQFLLENGLDGVDIDWEYPGAPDIPGIPAGDAVSGVDYLLTMLQLKGVLLEGMTVSLAAPASYWYLKAFPIEAFGLVIDYIVYMTYDLHGQWDYGNSWTSPGCPTGNCLRSHINMTETSDALSMITKAGVASNKVVVGVASYGRSFKMADAGCSGPECLFTGSSTVSDALPGRCTMTGGYISNAELSEIIRFGNVNKQWTDAVSDILVYNDTEWVAFMTDETRALRTAFYDAYNFAGTSDWAVDLREYLDGSDMITGVDPDYVDVIDLDFLENCDGVFTGLDDILNQADSLPPYCLEKYIVDTTIIVLSDSLSRYQKLLEDGYDKKFDVYQKYMTEQVPVKINLFMANGHADDYFDCEETGYRPCCSECNYATCIPICDKSADCVPGLKTRTWKITCPTGFRDGEMGDWETNPAIPNTTYTLTDSDGFYSAIFDQAGIEKDWIAFDDVDVQISGSCQFSDDVQACLRETNHWYWNYPVPAASLTIFNPKDIISQSNGNLQGVLDNLETLSTLIDMDPELSTADLVDGSAIPAFMAAAAVDSMENVVEEAGEIEEEEKKEMILNFVMGFLGLLGLVGGGLEASADSALLAIRSGLSIIDDVGNVALGIYSIVEDPQDPFMGFLTILLAANSRVEGLAKWDKPAAAARAIPKETLEKLGPVKDNLDKIEEIRGKTCRV